MFNLFSKTKQSSPEKIFGKNARVPQHVAIIMDGNGRWAQRQGLPRIAGHKRGADAARRTIKACVELGIKYLTVYTFSTENWKRPKEEVDALFGMLINSIDKEIPELKAQGARIQFRGRINELPEALQKKIAWAEEQTKDNSKIISTSMINYGSRAEITDAFKKIVSAKTNPDQITEELINKNLYTGDMPDPDLLIRTASEMRVSNYMLWQIAYSELYITPTLWPDFGREELIKAVKTYLKRGRRFGGIKNA